jgi:RHS repeat-associated protein
MSALSFFAAAAVLSTVIGFGNAVAQEVQTTRYEYDANGNPTRVVDPLGRATSQRYDAADRLTQQFLPSPTQGETQPTTTYAYDGRDQITSVTDPRGLATKYTVDGLGNQAGLASPDSGMTTRVFDAAGNLSSSKDARGQLTTFGYDELSRLVQITYAGGAGSTFKYDTGSAGAIGRLTEMSDESGQTRFNYDDSGRLSSKVQSVGFGALLKKFTLSYTYGTSGTALGKVSSIIYPSGNRLLFAYGAGGGVSSMTLVSVDGVAMSGSPIPLLTNISYRPFGDVAGWAWGNSSSANPNIYTRGFDQEGRIVSYPLGHPQNNGVVRTLRYDAGGRIGQSTHSGDTGAGRLDQNYYYDDLDRLTGFETANTSQGFSYDKNGNRTQARFGASSYVNTISATSNRLNTTSGPAPAKQNSYDATGNLISDGTITYTYGISGRLESARSAGVTVGYRYNGLGQRVAKTGPAGVITHYVYDEEGLLLGEYDGAGALIQETVYLGDLPVAVLTPPPHQNDAPAIHYVYADHLSTPRVITRANDNRMVWRWDQADPFGLYQPDENPSGLGRFTYNLRFPGQVFDKETNNHYNYFRDYDPLTGRYIQSDPIGLGGGINTYAYVEGNPVSLSDREGLAAAGAQIGGNIGALIGGRLGAPGIGRAIGAVAGSAIQDMCTDKVCPPCKTVSGKIVPVGTIGYRPLDNPSQPQHGITGPHYNIYQASQNPKNCQCFWQSKGAVPPSGLPAGAIPIEPFVN